LLGSDAGFAFLLVSRLASVRRRGLLTLAAGLALVLALWTAGCASPRSSPEGQGGAGGSPYQSPRTLRSGSYVPPVHSVPGATARGMAAQAIDERKPRFGGWMNGIYFVRPGESPPQDPRAGTVCPRSEVRAASEEQVRQHPRFPELSYVLPGMSEVETPSGSLCRDRVIVIQRIFSVGPYSVEVSVVRYPGSWFVETSVSRDRLSTGQIAGRPAVVKAPVTPEGYGESAIYIREEDGVTVVGALDLPLEELTRIAEGVR
jgi:hypothetical protein